MPVPIPLATSHITVAMEAYVPGPLLSMREEEGCAGWGDGAEGRGVDSSLR